MSIVAAAHLLDRLRGAGIYLWLDDGQLRFRAPPDTLTAELKAEIAALRPDVLRLLQAGTPTDTAPTPSGPVPLTPAQAAVWVSEQGGTAGDAYHITAALDLSGRLDTAAFATAWRHLAARHAALRSFVLPDGERPMQDCVAEIALPLSETEVATPEAAEGWLTEFLAKPFTLSHPPLWRVGLCQTGPDKALLAIAIHHLIADGGSVDVLLHEFAACYAAALSGAAPDLGPAPTGFPGIAALIDERRRTGGYEADLAWWQAALAGAPAALDLWPDSPAASAGPRTAALLRARLPSETTLGLRRLAAASGTTLFGALWTLFATLLHRYGAGCDITMTTPHIGREGMGQEAVVGLMTNRMALRADLSGDPTFRTLLRRGGETLRGAFAHAGVPFELVTERLDAPRDGQHAPFSQVLFAMQNAVRGSFGLAGLEVIPRPVASANGKADLYLAAEEDAGGIVLSLEYPTALFGRPRMERLLGHFARLAEAALAGPDTPVVRLSLMSEEERKQALSSATQPAGAGVAWTETRVEERFDAVAARMADAPALCGPAAWDDIDAPNGWHEISYGALRAWSDRIAARLAGAGPVVVLALPRSAAMVAAMLGILRSGAAYLPLDPDLPAERVEELKARTGARVLIAGAGARPAWAGTFDEVVNPSDLDATPDGSGCPPAGTPSGPGTRSDLAYLMFTSGSTGRPKGVATTHANVLHFVSHLPLWPDPAPSSVLQFAPVSFDASVMEIWGALLHGCRLVIAPPGLPDFASLGRLLRRGEVSFAWLTAGLFHAMAETSPEGLHGLRQLVAGGDALSPDRLRALFASGFAGRIANGYGPTETTVLASWHDITPDDVAEGKGGVPIGRAFGAARLYCLDERLEPVPRGLPGELVIGGPGVASGYFGQPELSAERFLPDPFSLDHDAQMYRTGDRVQVREEGVMEFLGRLDDQVKVRGFRIEPAEIARALTSYPALADAAVIAPEPETGSERRLIAYAVPRSGASVTAEDLRAHLATRLPDHMIPSAFVLMPGLPLTASGKLDRRALPPPGPVRPAPALLDTEALQALGAIWCALLKVKTVAPGDRFFELGGDSILAIQMVSRAARAGWHLSPQDVLRHQTLRDQAAIARRVEAEIATPEEPLSLALTPIQSWFMALDLPRLSPWNQAVRLRLAQGITAGMVSRAMTEMERCHAALRLRFAQRDGVWRATLARPGAAALQRIAGGSSEAEALRALHESLDPSEGPIWAALWIDGGKGPAELVLAAHHLAIDGVSWRILLEDLGRLLGPQSQAVLPPPRAGLGAWEQFLATRTAKAAAEETELWLDQPQCPPLATATCDGADIEGSVEVISLDLDTALTADLLGPANTAWRSSVTEMLITGLAMGYRAATGLDAMLVDLEHHGRDAEGAPDLSRTVGWFTAIAPLALSLPEGGSPADCVDAVKEAVRRRPDNGIGFGLLRHLGPPEIADGLARLPRAQVSINYLGQITRQTGDAALPFAISDGDTGPAIAPEAPRPYAVEVVALATDGRLRIDWRFGPAVCERGMLKAWAEATRAALRSLCVAAAADREGRVSPRDFPLLPALSGRALCGPGSMLSGADIAPRSVETLLPLTPQQLGALFETLADQGRGLHVEQFVVPLAGPLDPERLKRAWAATIARYPTLRTAFLWQGTPEPLQAVLRAAEAGWRDEDWRDAPEGAEGRYDARLAAWLDADRNRGFRLDAAPLMRLGLFRTGPETWLHIWSFHHILLDGWSVPNVLASVMTAYAADGAGPLPQGVGPGPKGYIAWLNARPAEEAQRFWQAELAGVQPPQVQTGEAMTEGFSETEMDLDADISGHIDAMARRSGVTVSTVLMAAWARVLAAPGAAEGILGVTVAARPPELPGCEEDVGLYINTLPLRIPLPGYAVVGDWLADLQRRTDGIRHFAHCSAGQIHRWACLPTATPIFDSIFVYENYPVGPGSTGHPGDIRVGEVTGHGARTRHPLTLLAMPGDTLRFRLVTDGARLHPAVAPLYLDALRQVLVKMVQPGARVADLEALAAGRHLPVRAGPTARETPPPKTLSLGPAEREVAALWEEVLGAAPGGTDAGFFDQGGHSLLMLELLQRWRRRFGFDLPLADFLQAPTVAGLARLLDRPETVGSPVNSGGTLVPLSAADAVPLFIAPGASGNPFAYAALAAALRGKVRLVAHDANSLMDAGGTSIEALGRDLAEAIERFQPEGRLHLAGHSLGAAVAHAAAGVLIDRGRSLAPLILIDQPAPGAATAPAPEDEAAWLAAIAEAAARYLGRDIVVAEAELRQLGSAARRQLFLDRLMGAGVLPADSAPALVDLLLHRYRAAFAACAGYQPAKVEAEAVVIRGAQSDVAGAGDLGWARVCRGSTMVTVCGDHISMITAVHANELAAAMLATLASEVTA